MGLANFHLYLKMPFLLCLFQLAISRFLLLHQQLIFPLLNLFHLKRDGDRNKDVNAVSVNLAIQMDRVQQAAKHTKYRVDIVLDNYTIDGCMNNQ